MDLCSILLARNCAPVHTKTLDFPLLSMSTRDLPHQSISSCLWNLSVWRHNYESAAHLHTHSIYVQHDAPSDSIQRPPIHQSRQNVLSIQNCTTSRQEILVRPCLPRKSVLMVLRRVALFEQFPRQRLPFLVFYVHLTKVHPCSE